jgi:hypothetical protein
MSHFSVLVRLPSEISSDQLEERLGAMLDPYCEHENDSRSRPFFEFVDEEDEHRRQYETESTEMIRCADGALVLPWDARFRVPGSLGYSSNSHHVPSELERVQVAHRERFATFEEFMSDWHGSAERDPEKKRYGHWRNPNAKWDYWRIGGRWRGDLLIKAGTVEAGVGELSYEWSPKFHEGEIPGGPTEADWCRIRDLDHEKIAAVSRERANKFWSELDQFISGREFGFGEGPRSTLLDLGILDCKDADEMTGDEFWTKKWKRQVHQGVDRFDVIAKKPDRDVLDARVLAHLNPIRPWAYLDANGWRERGRMGWFGMGSDTPESNEQHAHDFDAWLRNGDQGDWIVVVDCHI